MMSFQALFFTLLSLSLVLAQPTPAPDVCTNQCPPLNFPNPSCLDGTTAVVVCTLQTNGQCGYSISCPRTAAPSPAPCTAFECGTEPSFSPCSNGTRAASTCSRLADNTCLWFSGLCPGEPEPTLPPCTLDACGPLNFLVSNCPDGTTPAVVCGRRVDKSCGYQVQPCASNTTKAPTLAPTTGAPTPAPVGSSCKSNSDCSSRAFCQLLNCGSTAGLCALYDITCPEFNSSVCGCDNVTYRSSCAATQAKVTVQYGGPCLSGSNTTIVPTAPTSAPTNSPTPSVPTAAPNTTAAPSTAAPSTAAPSTAAPSSASTAAPSTATPSTAAPSTSTGAPTTTTAPTTRTPTTLPPIVTYPTPGYVPPASPTPATTPAPTPAPTPFTPPTPAPPTPPIVFPTPAGSVKSSGPVPTPIFVQPPTYPTPALVFPTARRFRPEDVRPLATPPTSSPTYARVLPPTPPIIAGDFPAPVFAGYPDNHPYLFNHRNVPINEAGEVVESAEK